MDNRTKIQLLKKNVTVLAEQEAAKIEESAKEIVKSRFLEEQQRLDQEVKELTQVRERELKDQMNRQLSQKTGAYRQDILKAREQYIDDIFQKVQTKLADFRNSPEYKEYLKKNILQAENEIGPILKVYVSESDLEILAECGFNGGRFQAFADDSIRLGGLIIECQGKIVDSTFDAKLRSERKNFVSSGIFAISEQYETESV